MRLRDLNPEWGTVDVDHQPDLHWLTFDCRATPKGRVYVQFHAGPAVAGRWQCTSYPVNLDTLTLTPSIGDHSHGRTGRCPGHVNITNGEVIP